MWIQKNNLFFGYAILLYIFKSLYKSFDTNKDKSIQEDAYFSVLPYRRDYKITRWTALEHDIIPDIRNGRIFEFWS